MNDKLIYRSLEFMKTPELTDTLFYAMAVLSSRYEMAAEEVGLPVDFDLIVKTSRSVISAIDNFFDDPENGAKEIAKLLKDIPPHMIPTINMAVASATMKVMRGVAVRIDKDEEFPYTRFQKRTIEILERSSYIRRRCE